MKTAFVILSGLAVAMAQAPTTLPSCGQNCINNMLAIATQSLGCSSGDAGCYCTKPEFGFGIRDCANEACGSEAAEIISYGSSYCQSALATVSGASQTASGLGSVSGGAGGAMVTTMAITTSDLLSTVSNSNTDFTTTVGSTTIFTTSTISGSGNGTGNGNGTAVGGGSGSMSTGASESGASGSGMSGMSGMSGSGTGTETGASGSGSGSGGASSSSKSGNGAIITGAPVMGLAAGAAALMML